MGSQYSCPYHVGYVVQPLLHPNVSWNTSYMVTYVDFVKRVQCSYDIGWHFLLSLLLVLRHQRITFLSHSGLPESVLADVCCLMTEGRYPGLYSDIDMQNMATAMTPGQVQTKKLDKIELSFERYLKKVRQNMHIFVCLDISGKYKYQTSLF